MLKRWKILTIGIGSALTASGAIASAIVVPLVKQSKYDIQYWENGAAINSLNYVTRGNTALNTIYGFYMEGLVKNITPRNVQPAVAASYLKRKWTKNYTQANQIKISSSNPLESSGSKTIANLFESRKKLDINDFDKITGDPLFADFATNTPEKFINSEGDTLEIAMADVFEYYSNVDNPSLRARIHENAKWSNGKKVTAADFVQTLKYILNRKNASLLQQKTYEILKLRGAKEILDLQSPDKNKNPLTFEEAWNKLEQENNLPVTIDGIDNRWVHYHFEVGAPSSGFLANYLGGDIFMPTNKEFVDSIGGILKYGQTKDTILSNGPYQPDQLDLDYLIVFKRNPHYYEREAVFLDHPAYKVSPSQSIQMQLFKDKKLAQIEIAPELLQSFYSDPEMAKLVQNGATTPNTKGLLFSKYYADQNPNSPSANKNFRKAIQYGINRINYAAYLNNPGSTPANTIYTPRTDTDTVDENGKTYYDFLRNKNYEEIDPITNKKISIPFFSYDRETQVSSFYSKIHNNNYKDFMYQEELANHFLEKYLQETNQKSVNLQVVIRSAEENNFLALKSTLNEIFGKKINVTSKLVSLQLMQEAQYSGEYMSMFMSTGSTTSDPWGVYSYFAIEDGYDEDKGQNTPFVNKKNNPSMEITSRYWKNPGFEFRDYIKTLSADDKKRLRLISKHELAYEEAATNDASANASAPLPGKAPVYKYANEGSIIKSSKDGMIQYENKKFPARIYPYFTKDDSKQKNWLFKNTTEIFDWYATSENLLRDSAYFVPFLGSLTSFFATRRGLRLNGNTMSMPYGYQFIYPKDDRKLIDKIEKEVLKNTGIAISLDRI